MQTLTAGASCTRTLISPSQVDTFLEAAMGCTSRDGGHPLDFNDAIGPERPRRTTRHQPVDVLSHFPGAVKAGKGWKTHCPAHQDGNASLSLAEGNNGGWLVHCHAGCSPEAVAAAAGLTLADLMPQAAENRRRNDGPGRVVARYVYTDEAGAELFQCRRYEPKSFRQGHSGPDGRWIPNLDGVRRVLYRLPQVGDAVESGATVFIVEGEKDADNLVAAGLVATTSPMGAGKWRPEYGDSLQGAVAVVIIADKDEPGRRHAARVAASLHGNVGAVKVLELPDINGHHVKDFTDWRDAGGTREGLEALVSTAPAWTPGNAADAPETAAPGPTVADPEMNRRRDIAAFCEGIVKDVVGGNGQHAGELVAELRRFADSMEIPPDPPACAEAWLPNLEPLPPCHIPGLIEATDRACITGQSKARKSFVAKQMACCLAAGHPFLFFPPGPPRRVLVVNLEIKSSRYQRRLRAMTAGLGIPAEDLCGLFIWNAADETPGVALWPKIRAQAERVKADIVVVDPLYRTFEGDESDTDTVKAIVSEMTSLTRTGRTLIYVHHAPKGRAGDRQAIDRGSGSGIWCRDVSTLLSLVEHEQDGLLVLETITRDHPPRPPETVAFDSEAGCFRHVPGTTPAVKTSASAARRKAVETGDTDKAAALVEAPMLYKALRDMLQERMAIAKNAAERLIAGMVEAGTLTTRRGRGGIPGKRGNPGTYYAKPGQFVDGPESPWESTDQQQHST